MLVEISAYTIGEIGIAFGFMAGILVTLWWKKQEFVDCPTCNLPVPKKNIRGKKC